MTYEQSKQFLKDYVEAGYRTLTYMCDGYVKLRYTETDYLQINPKQIIRVTYLHDEVAYIKFGNDKYNTYWSQQKIQSWINDNFRLIKAQFIRTQ